MKSKFLQPFLALFNAVLLLLQLFAMGVFGYAWEYPLFTLSVPLLSLVNLLFFIFWAMKLRWSALLFVMAFLLSFQEWGKLYQWPNNSIPTDKGLHVMSFNVRTFNRFRWIDRDDIPKAVEAFVNEAAPDVVCFQEYDNSNAPEFSKYPYRYFHSTKNNKKIGSCILSKYPLFNKNTVSFENSTNGGVYGDIKWGKDTLRIYNMHFESLRILPTDTLFATEYSEKFIKKLDQVFDKQNSQIQQFLQINASVQHPIVLCTDLNNVAFSSAYNQIRANNKDAFVAAGNGLGTTYKFSALPFRIDYIFTDPRLKVTRFQTHHKIKLSDHKPISAHILLP